MVWFKVDDTLAFHEKVVQAGNASMGLWVRAGSWAAQQLTDGFVPDHIVTTLGTRGQARALADVGLWLREDSGYRFHGWFDYQPTKEQVEKDRAAARERMKRGRGAKKQPDGSLEVQANTERTSGDVRLPRPDPSRPGTTEMSFEGGSHVSSGSPATPPRFPDHCQQHADVAVPGKCGDCADARKARAAMPHLALVVSETQKCLVHMTPDVAHCNGCAADRLAGEAS